MPKTALLTAIAISILAPFSGKAANLAAAAKPWKVGEERELIAGTYIKLIAVSDGWRIWREEHKNGWVCSAVKPAKTLPHPQPMSSSFFYGSYPAIIVSETKVLQIKRIDWSLVGRNINPTEQQIKPKGERFYTKRPDLFAPAAEWNKLLELDGRLVEAHVGSWKYPAVAVDYAERTGIIDLTGLTKAVERIKACNAAK